MKTLNKIFDNLIRISLFITVIVLVVAGYGAEDTMLTMQFNIAGGVCAIIYLQLQILDRLER